jgi:hypothetical protein
LANVTVSCTRTHRERKEAYTKSLEREVVQLRANEAQILQETRRLYAEITTMKRVMAAHGIEVPTIEPNATDQNQPGVAVSLDVTNPNEVFDLSIRVTNNKQKHRHIHVHRHASPGTNQKSTPSDAFDISHSSECTHTTPPSHPIDLTVGARLRIIPRPPNQQMRRRTRPNRHRHGLYLRVRRHMHRTQNSISL